jgi:CRP-like cAMP-binding protein
MASLLELSKNRILAGLPAEDIATLALQLNLVELEKGRIIDDVGDAVTHVYFPNNCVISIMTLMEGGEAIESATIGCEGAYGLLAAAAPREANSRAIVQVPGQAWRIAAAQLQGIWRRSSSLRALADRHADALLAHTAQSVACNALHSVEARFCRWLLACCDRIDVDTVNLTQEFLASMLGVQRTTVTAVAQSLQEKNLIRYRRGVVDILDRRGLQASACECYGTVRRTYDRLIPDQNGPRRSAG